MAKRKNVYEADDGTPFETLKEAVAHDRDLAAIKYLNDVLIQKGVAESVAINVSIFTIEIYNDIGSILKGKSPKT